MHLKELLKNTALNYDRGKNGQKEKKEKLIGKDKGMISGRSLKGKDKLKQ